MTHKVDKADLSVSKYKVGYIAYKFKANQSPDVQPPTKDTLTRILTNGTSNIVDSSAPKLRSAATDSTPESAEGVLTEQQPKGFAVNAANKKGVMEKTNQNW